MAKAKKKAAPKEATGAAYTDAERDDAIHTALRLMEKNAVRITALEERQTLIIDGFKFVADQLRSSYGTQGIAQAFDAVVAKLRP